MKKTSLLLAGALSICGVAIAAPKTYNITLPATAKAGALELAKGDYKLKIDGGNAVFTDQAHKTFTAPIKTQNVNRKFIFTAVETAPEGSGERITAIDLAGSTTQVEFTK